MMNFTFQVLCHLFSLHLLHAIDPNKYQQGAYYHDNHASMIRIVPTITQSHTHSNSKKSMLRRGENREYFHQDEEFSSKECSIDLTQVTSIQNQLLAPSELNVQLCGDIEPIEFKKKFSIWGGGRSYYWYGEKGDDSFSMEFTGRFFEGVATINGTQFSFTTSPSSNDNDKGDIIASVQQLDLTTLPKEASETENRRLRTDMKNETLIERRNTPSTFFDDGSVVDLLCVYTRQALEALCEESGGKKCDRNYPDYRGHMDLKCQLAVDQTVSMCYVQVCLNVHQSFRTTPD